MKVVTCGDAKFFEFLKALEENIFTLQGEYPVIYDLGLREEQRKALRSEVVSVSPPGDFSDISAAGYVKATHKAAVVLDALERFEQSCLLIDADVLFTARVREAEVGGVDVSVTPRHPKFVKESVIEGNGVINSGVLYFAHTTAAAALLQEWKRKCAEGTASDQKVLSDMISGLDLTPGTEPGTVGVARVRSLDPLVYNDTDIRTGKIIHFKKLSRDSKALAKWRKWSGHLARHPALVRAFFRLRLLQCRLGAGRPSVAVKSSTR